MKNSRGGTHTPAQGIEETGRVRFNGRTAFFALLLFFSGMAALIYQVLWIRQLSVVVGVEVYSITIAVSAFFAGLAGGGALLGRLADRWKRPLLLYFVLESCVAVAGVLATVAMAHAAGLFVAIQAHTGLLAWALPFLLVGAPAFLMGGTLPVAVQWQVRELIPLAKAGGWVYAVNTAGGIAGALLSSFVFLPWLGVRGTALVAALFNLMAACIALVVGRRSESASTEGAAERVVDVSPVKSRTALALYAVAGGIALGYEVVWSQALAQFLSTRVFAFSVVLATYLAGLVVGSALYVRFAARLRDAWGVFGLLISAAGVIALLEIAFLSLWQLRIQVDAGSLAFAVSGSEFARMCTQFAVASVGVVFLPTVLLGAAFPAALRLTAGAERAGRDVGRVIALNTAGGIAGTLLTGFLLIPRLGIVVTLSMLAIGAALVGALAVLLGWGVGRKTRWAVLALGAIAVAGGVVTPSDRMARLLLTTRGGGELIFYQEGRGATVAVAQQQSGDNVFRRLYIQGVSNSGDAMPSLRYMRLQAMLPLLIHRGEPKSALVIGFGTGITAGAVLHYPGLQRRVCVELLPAVVRAGELFPENYKVGSDPRLQIRIGDGRQELLRSADRYDLITLEPPPPSAEGVVNLYSTDFYRLASKRLETDGLFAQWLPISTQNDEDTRSLVRSFLDVFPYATLWSTELHEMLLIGSFSPIEPDAGTVTRRFNQSGVSTALQAVGISSPAAALATWVTGRDSLERYAGNVRAVTDDYPRIEYASWVHPKEITRTLPELLALRSDLPLAEGDDVLRAEIVRQRQGLLDFYTAGIAAYNGDRATWSAAMQRVLAADSGNPYYRWIIGEGR
ncbi:MAG TPA: fused MFS/spermidine synthase [Alloacidobacterium sp.]|nr:fused MFS/spermidine synthase [Alloacidobacterium sp.]